ncbi:hypothetical protein PPL_11806 [Heterostelium album PN500]|uniref:Uncharacterized protein n=1 Tax=Heterostelium pallidum (strain ATCC 26659 / Pp 5 / PN500) TaxID=670386 RepID=D3BUI6_HETP5|nr:hypothetical protein PPL_11806 [Heterostelium album PN500]EFA74774.1 hypothetical protein PPL_11806 [Heterostelium album PN500]|eukprot:XP_020426908.1 hypothetical protein PPL_11806 [Heterostelium album PN500]
MIIITIIITMNDRNIINNNNNDDVGLVNLDKAGDLKYFHYRHKKKAMVFIGFVICLIILKMTLSIQSLGEIIEAHVIVRNHPSFNSNYYTVNRLGTQKISDMVAIMTKNFTDPDQESYFQPLGNKKGYTLPKGYGISVKYENSTYYFTDFTTNFQNGTSIDDMGFISAAIVKDYRSIKSIPSDDPNDLINQPIVAQPSIFMQIALFELLNHWGITPSIMVGHRKTTKLRIKYIYIISSIYSIHLKIN